MFRFMKTTRKLALQHALRCVADPRTFLLIAVLLVNDHVLRRLWPSWWTGKIGDVAWLGFAPLVLAVPIALAIPDSPGGRRDRPVRLAALVVGGVFVLGKTLPAAHAVLVTGLETGLGWRPALRRDPTDLITLPALLVSLGIWKRNCQTVVRSRPATALISLAVACVATIANTPPLPCDREVDDPSSIEQAIRGDPFVAALLGQVHSPYIGVPDCFFEGQMGVELSFDLPVGFSRYGIEYHTYVSLVFSEDGSLEIDWDRSPLTEDRTADGLISSIKETIQIVEAEPRIEEFMENVKTGEPEFYGRLSYWEFSVSSSFQISEHVTSSGPSLRFEWDPTAERWFLDSYDLPTGFKWRSYPELEAAEVIAQDRLLEPEFEGCALARDPMEVQTYSSGIRQDGGDAWRVAIELRCPEGLRELSFDVRE